MTEKILVIKLGALGDMVQALGPFAAIRAHHPDAIVTLLTTRPFVEFAQASGLFDQVWVDEKPRGMVLSQWRALRRRLRSGKFVRVYDLQTSDRSSFYQRLFWPKQKPEWSGIARRGSHPHANPNRDILHTIERQAEQLKFAGVENVPGPEIVPTLTGLDAPLEKFSLEGEWALFIPGGAPHRPEKRWQMDKFASLAVRVAEKGYTPVLLGGPAEAEVLEAIHAACHTAVDLCGKTSLLEIAGLARRARLAVGNDTGPMHLIAALGCSSVVLYSEASDPALCGQRGPKVTYLRKPKLKDVTVDDVLAALQLA